ncbi:uncharacterized, partial [Tachysurus ichikawai]
TRLSERVFDVLPNEGDKECDWFVLESCSEGLGNVDLRNVACFLTAS